MASPFQVVGELSVVQSATVVCLRNIGRKPCVLKKEEFLPSTQKNENINMIFGTLDSIDFSDGWEVLMGQSECVNWVRSTSLKDLKTMRYAGEYKFAGGNLDGAETFREAARRELEEEFLRPVGLPLPDEAVIRPFVVKQTMPVRSKSNIMWNMVAVADENPWLAELDVKDVNCKLRERRKHFAQLMDTDQFWKLSQTDREIVAPEVRELRWIPLAEAVFLSLSTMVGNGKTHKVNNWQAAEFERLGIKRRDPMFITAATLMEIAAFPNVDLLLAYCRRMDNENMMSQELARVQWLFPGMTNEDVQSAREPKEVTKDAKTILELRAARVRQANTGHVARL